MKKLLLFHFNKKKKPSVLKLNRKTNVTRCFNDFFFQIFRWEVAVAPSLDGFKQMSFVNSIATTKGGRHIDHVSKLIENALTDTLKKKNKGGINVKPHQVHHLQSILLNIFLVNRLLLKIFSFS